jgi:hypothetical protein
MTGFFKSRFFYALKILCNEKRPPTTGLAFDTEDSVNPYKRFVAIDSWWWMGKAKQTYNYKILVAIALLLRYTT